MQTSDQSLKSLIRENLLDKVLLFFGEELKKDDKENNKAWRAFQRLLLEGIKKDIREVKDEVNLIKEDLQKLDNVCDQNGSDSSFATQRDSQNHFPAI